jgi:hypothetical protein
VPSYEHSAPPDLDAEREPTPREALQHWMEDPIRPPGGTASLATIFHHFGTLWYRRHLPNVALFHFADYQADLTGELVRLGQVLGYNLTRDRAEELAGHASLNAMRAHAAELTPDASEGVWRNNERFFRAGGRGEWQEIFTEAEHWRYIARLPEVGPRDLGGWAHEGRRGCDPDSAT